MKWSQLACIAAVVGTMLSMGCQTDDPSDKTNSCTVNTDCDPGFYCGADDKCTQDCDPASATSACPGGQSCDSTGRCVVSGECISNDDCDQPPEDASCEGDTLVSYSAVGMCVEENGETSCVYSETREQCENGCVAGFCLNDPCAAVSCDAPPAPTCDPDGQTLIAFGDPGTCTEGVCDYAEMPMSCALGCAGGACLTGTCDNETCENPPADTCDGKTAIRYADAGECIDSDGTPICDYAPEFENCGYLGPEGDCAAAQCEGAVNQVGGIVIREFMANPAGSFNDFAEWFEIVNVSGAAIDLDGWTIKSDGASMEEMHPIVGPLVVEAGDSAVFVLTDAVSFAFDYDYAGISLANNTDYLLLENTSGEVVDYVFYESGSILAGRSRKLNPAAPQDVTANDDFANWCPSMTDEFATGPSNYGTPGADNTACAGDPCGGFTCSPPQGFCVDGENRAIQYVGNPMCEVSRFNNPFCDYDTMEVQCTDGAQLCALGECRDLPTNLPAAGDLIITEFMPNPDGTDTDREWVEIYNTTGADISMFSVILRNDSGSSTAEYQFLDPNLIVPSNGYVVLVREVDSAINGGIEGGFNYSGGNLVNGASGADLLALYNYDGTLIDSAYYDNPTDGASYQLDPGSLDGTSNDDAANWCAGQTTYGDGGDGTPGAANEPCMP